MIEAVQQGIQNRELAVEMAIDRRFRDFQCRGDILNRQVLYSLFRNQCKSGINDFLLSDGQLHELLHVSIH